LAWTLKKAVEPFYTTKGGGMGTGLGLSMVKGLAEQSGGFFKLHSKKGEGTRAEIYLPVAAGAAEEAVKPQEQQGADGTKMRVLAVDDDPLVLLNTLAMLEDLGHEPVEATSGAKALDILSGGEKIDLVVTDQAMPHMTGMQLVETIRTKWPERIGHWAKTRRLLARFSGPEASVHSRYLVDFTITTSEFWFSVHTSGDGKTVVDG
jgi:hypothetical protein